MPSRPNIHYPFDLISLNLSSLHPTTQKMRITVLGASGIQGRHQIHSLALSNHTVIAASRTPPALPPHPSVTHIATDFTNPEDIHFAVQGVDRVFVNLPSTSFAPAEPILDAARVVGEACKRAGVGLIVFNTSMPIPLQTQNIKAQDDRREIRRLLRASGVPVISIEPVVYLDNLLEGWAVRALREENKVVYCHKPDLRVSWVCHHDVATIMCAAMHKLDWGTQERNIRVGGPETVVLSGPSLSFPPLSSHTHPTHT